jgi:hypothetical protein
MTISDWKDLPVYMKSGDVCICPVCCGTKIHITKSNSTKLWWDCEDCRQSFVMNLTISISCDLFPIL